MSIAFVQTASNTGTTTCTVTLGPTTGGNCLVACVALGASSNLSSVSGITLGGVNDNWAQLRAVGSLVTGAEQLAMWADPNCATGQTSVVVTLAGGASASLVQVFEFSGIATSSILDQSGTFDSAGGSNPTFSVSTGAPTAFASELAVGCVYGYNSTTTGPSSPWVNETTLSSTTRRLQAGYNILSSTGTVTYSGSFGGSTFNGQVLVTLVAAAQPSPPAGQYMTQRPVTVVTNAGWRGAQHSC